MNKTFWSQNLTDPSLLHSDQCCWPMWPSIPTAIDIEECEVFTVCKLNANCRHHEKKYDLVVTSWDFPHINFTPNMKHLINHCHVNTVVYVISSCHTGLWDFVIALLLEIFIWQGQGPVSLTVFPSQFKFDGNYVWLSSWFQYSEH